MFSAGCIFGALGGAVLGASSGVAALMLTTSQPGKNVDAIFGGPQHPVVATMAPAKPTPSPPPASPAVVQAAHDPQGQPPAGAGGGQGNH
jgi:hypothetical protein